MTWSLALRWRWPSLEMLDALKRWPMMWKGGFPRIRWCTSVTCRWFEHASLSIRAIPRKRSNCCKLQFLMSWALACNSGQLYPIYVRGEAYLAAHQGAEAAAEFQKIIEHRGVVGSDPIGALAHLQTGKSVCDRGREE